MEPMLHIVIIKSIINEAGFGTFFEALLNHETHEYKDLQLLLALAEHFWDITCTFHFPCIGEVMLTPFDFSIITSLRLGGERIRARMFMLPFIGTFLCPDLGSTVNFLYLESLKRVGQIRNYNWSGMAYATLMHFMTQLSRWSLSSLGGAPFVWQVWMYKYFGVGHETQEEVVGIFPRFLRWLPISSPSELLFVIFRMNLNPWTRCEGYVECERALELNGRQVLFECGHGNCWYLGDWVLPQVEHVYPPTTILVHPCPSIWLADILTDEEVTQAREEEGDEEEEIPSPDHAGSSSSSFSETYPHFLA
ncbi:hypothetical protein ACB092_09G164400 [Castanea dentata]